MNTVQKFPIIVSDVRLTKPTMAIAGVNTWSDLVTNQAILFKNLTDEQLLEKIVVELHKNKLKAVQVKQLSDFSKEQKRQYLINNLSVTIELTQDIERVDSGESADDPFNANLSRTLKVFMSSRLNITDSSNTTKYHFQTSTVENALNLDVGVGVKLDETLAEQGIFAYIARVHSYKPEVNPEGYIVSAPKRAGKDGDILTKDGNLIFMHTRFILQEGLTPAQMNQLYSDLYTKELANHTKYIADKDGNIPADSVPKESRLDDGSGRFNPEFEAWLHKITNLQLDTPMVVAPASR